MAKVYVGLSGGVDSSVTAALLKEQGYDVTGVFMKNWTRDIGGQACPWRTDLADAKRVAVQLDIPFEVFDFQKQYKQKVVDYMLAEYKAGRTPNPDVMCNQEVKFKLFLDTALDRGADLIATGHYARVKPLAASPAGPAAEPATPRSSRQSAVSAPPVLARRASKHATLRSSARPGSLPEPEASHGEMGLYAGVDKDKDQSYFLYRVSREALKQTLMPIGEFKKPEVRALAKKYGLATANKPDSQGICFVGEVGIADFLAEFVQLKPGPIIETKAKQELGRHEGALLYTIGQRHGLGLGGGLPYYVTATDVKKNIVYVSTQLDDDNFWRDEVEITDLHWIDAGPRSDKTYKARLRYRGELLPAKIKISGRRAKIKLDKPERAVAAGQSAVIYDGQQVLGGGIIS